MKQFGKFQVRSDKLFLILFITFSAFALHGCTTDIFEEETEVYFNNFNDGDLQGIVGAEVWNFSNRQILGPFNNDGFTLQLNNLPSHRIIKINFDIYIHDSWDGNAFGPDGPDLWYLGVDDKVVFETTFSNSPCEPPYCLQQSYPDAYLSSYFPRTSALSTNFPGRCHFQNQSNGTSLYRIEKRIGHSAASAKIDMWDLLTQPNSPDPRCDESWSIDNLRISVIAIK